MSIRNENRDNNLDRASEVNPNKENTGRNSEPVELKKKNSLKTVIKEESTLSPAKVVITALTAVSVAIISTKLTSVLNGITLAALVAVISAILTEAYRIVTALTAHGVGKAVLPIERRNKEDRQTETNDEAKQDNEGGVKPLHALREYFARRKNMQLVALFATTAILTIGTSFLVAKSLGEPSLISNSYPTEVRAEQLTEEEKQAIIDKAVNEATESPSQTVSPKVNEEATPTESPTQDSSDSSATENESKAEDKNPTRTPGSPKTQTEDSAADVDELREEIRKLQNRLAEVEGNKSADQTESSKNVSPEPASPEGPPPEGSVTESDLEDLQRQIDDLEKALAEKDSDETPTTSPESTTPSESPSEDVEESARPSSSPESSKAAPSDGGS